MCWHQKVFVQMFQFLLNCHPSSKYTLRWWDLFFALKAFYKIFLFYKDGFKSNFNFNLCLIWNYQYVCFFSSHLFWRITFFIQTKYLTNLDKLFFHWSIMLCFLRFNLFYLYCKMSLTFSVMNYTSLLYFAEFIIEPLRKHQQYSTQLHNGREIIK